MAKYFNYLKGIFQNLLSGRTKKIILKIIRFRAIIKLRYKVNLDFVIVKKIPNFKY